ncbi:MAG: type II toxin-antitoxin system prevent-host-death family antitoxin [Halofilum sp. (in: g-proteobacteria)]
MQPKQISLAHAKAHLSELTELTAVGETVVITKHGKPIGQLAPWDSPRKSVDLMRLQRVTNAMPRQSEDAGRFMRGIREDTRY